MIGVPATSAAVSSSAYRCGMPAALIWLIFALGLAAAEVLTGDLFLVVSVLLLVLVRPALRRRLSSGPVLPEPAKALEGKDALVLDQVSRHQGRVKLDGEVWTARSYNSDDIYEPGDRVTVMHIDGATAVVWRN